MGKLIISTQITLDGVMTVGEWFNQHGEHDWHGSAGQASFDQLRAADAFSWDARTMRVCQPSGRP
jgi:hypothetical protein